MTAGGHGRQRAFLTILTVAVLVVAGVASFHWLRAHYWPGSLAGQVTFHGTVPPERSYTDNTGRKRLAREVLISEAGEVSEALVWLQQRLSGGKWIDIAPVARPSSPELSKEKLQFRGDGLSRRVVALHADEALEVENQDNHLHNFHTLHRINRPVNHLLVPNFELSTLRFPIPEPPVAAICDLHPVERAFLVSFGHPYFAITDADGRFEITGIPPGEYRAGIWHVRLGEQAFPIRIVGGRTVRHDATLSP